MFVAYDGAKTLFCRIMSNIFPDVSNYYEILEPEFTASGCFWIVPIDNPPAIYSLED